MAKFEIERKFLVPDDSYKALSVKRIEIMQGYLSRKPEATVRVRIKNETAVITIKGITRGYVREEYEYEIPVEDAHEMMKMCDGLIINKTRWVVPFNGFEWEVDEFHGALQGLTLAEVELPSTDIDIKIPSFIGQDVSADPRFFNSNLSDETLTQNTQSS